MTGAAVLLSHGGSAEISKQWRVVTFLRCLFGFQAALCAYYVLNLFGGCTHCSRSPESLLMAALGLVFYSFAFSGLMKATGFYLTVCFVAGLVHTMLGGLMLDRRHACFVCYIALSVGAAIVAASMFLCPRRVRVYYGLSFALLAGGALVFNPLSSLLAHT